MTAPATAPTEAAPTVLAPTVLAPTVSTPPKPVLVFSGGPVTQSLWRPLSEKYQLAFLVPAAAQLAAEMGLSDVLSVLQLAHNLLREDASNQATLLSAQVVNNLPAITQRFAEAYGPDSAPVLGADVKDWLPGFIHFHLIDLVTLLMALEKFVENYKVVGYVTHEDLTPGLRAATLFFRSRNVPTLHLPHAACHLLPEAGPDIHRETRTDFILASGQYMKEWYAANGFGGRTVVVGAPQWDGLYDSDLPSKAEARRVLKITTEHSVCYATTWGQTTSLRSEFEVEFKRGLDAVLELAKAQGSTLIIKMHPNEAAENEAFYAKELEKANVPGLVTRHHNGYILRAVDLLIAQGPSNLCIEAAILGLPSVYLQTEGFDFQHALPFRCLPADLPSLAEQALASRGAPDWDCFVSHYNAAHPRGDATDTCVEVIEELCPA